MRPGRSVLCAFMFISHHIGDRGTTNLHHWIQGSDLCCSFEMQRPQIEMNVLRGCITFVPAADRVHYCGTCWTIKSPLVNNKTSMAFDTDPTECNARCAILIPECVQLDRQIFVSIWPKTGSALLYHCEKRKVMWDEEISSTTLMCVISNCN